MAAAASSYTTTRVREVEHHTASACKFEAATLSINSGDENNDATSSSSSSGGCWGIYVENENDVNVNAAAFSSVHIPPENMADYAAGGGTAAILTDSGDDSGSKKKKNLVPCQALAEGTTLRVAPMERSSGGWSPDHFHKHLRLPTATTTTGGGAGIKGGIVVLLEAMAHECLAIALSPDHDYVLGKTYVVHFGANGNLQTVLRRHVNYTECIDVAIPSRVCSEEKWISYWIVLQHGKLSAGVGKLPGKNCIGTLDDSMYDMLRSGVDAVKYVGIGNSALKRNARDLRVRNVRVCGIPSHFGLEGVPMETGGDGGVGGEEGDDGSSPAFKFVNILEMDEFFGRGGSGSSGRMVESYMPSDAELLAEYEKERTKARARATKFGIEYHEPPPDAFLKWSEARRLRANPEKGFITGIDTFSTVEKDKALARKRRFALEKRKAEGGGGGGGMEEEDDENIENSIDVGEGEEGEDAMLGDDDYYDEEDNVAEWEKAKKDPLPVEQAWENWNIVQQFRVDPPPTQTESGSSNGVQDEVGTMEGNIPFLPSKQSATIMPTKIHLFSIDWAPFKQIRTDDILSYFRDYGPSYVEWLGEISCNVLFEDKYSAARAFHAMSQELPSPPPQTSAGDGLVDASADGGTNIMMESAEHESTNTGDKERNGMDVADVAAADDNTPKDNANQEIFELLPDYGSMGWRFCKWTVRKVSNDRYGKRGTQARVLMRLATSIDVLDDRPTEWPKPPPGFTTKRVLMPWHDFSGSGRRGGGGRRDNKRRRRGSNGKRDRRDHGRDNDPENLAVEGGEHPGLATGLRSKRSGFSMEEIHAQRNAKYA